MKENFHRQALLAFMNELIADDEWLWCFSILSDHNRYVPFKWVKWTSYSGEGFYDEK
jgi:hypothetical protein